MISAEFKMADALVLPLKGRKKTSREKRPSPTIAKKAAFDRLKARLDEIERGKLAASQPAGALVSRASETLRLRPAALNEIRADDWRNAPAALAFALALAGKRARETGKTIFALSLAHEAQGAIFGPGLSAYGINLSSLIAASAPNKKMLLWAAEEAARCEGIAAVLVEAFRTSIDLTATRRLHLAAESSGAAAILIRMGPAEPSASAARWRVAPFPSRGDPDDIKAPGPPRLSLAIERCRKGGRGMWMVEWNDEAEEFAPVPESVAAALADRPAEAPRRVVPGGRTARSL